jgi:hypothetical protein
MKSDTSEKGLEALIVSAMTDRGWVAGKATGTSASSASVRPRRNYFSSLDARCILSIEHSARQATKSHSSRSKSSLVAGLRS